MNIQENTLYTKYGYLAPKHGKITKKQFHKIYQEYEQHPERKAKLIKRLKVMSIKKNSMYNTRKNKSLKMRNLLIRRN